MSLFLLKRKGSKNSTNLLAGEQGVSFRGSTHNMNQKTSIDKVWIEYKEKLFSFIRSKVETAEDTEEILSEVFMKLIKFTGERDAPNNLGAWLYRVTKNGIADYYRSKSRFEQLPEYLYEENDDPDAIRALAQCMLPMIQALPQNYQQPLILSEIDGKKYKEVAEELCLTLPAVKSRILRGREKLYRSILSCCEISRDSDGKVVDYELKPGNSCSDCNG